MASFREPREEQGDAMFRRLFGLIGRQFVRRPRIVRAAFLGGAAFALGRRNRSPSSDPPGAGTTSDAERRLAALADLHAAGYLDDEEFNAAMRRLQGSPD
jgi:hypothetical protein